MGSMKLDLLTKSANSYQMVDKIFNAAFGPSPALYRQVSLCGWRTLHSPPPSIQHPVYSRPEQDKGSISERPTGIEVSETCEAMTIKVALTYVKEESLHLSISGKTVIIRGERIMSAQRGKGASYPFRGQTYFQHLIALPATVKAGGFRAQLKGDVVQIDFAKRRP